jgi:hypothetical protein
MKKMIAIWSLLIASALYTVKIEYNTPKWAGVFAVCIEGESRHKAMRQARRMLTRMVSGRLRIERVTVWKDECDRLNDM